MKKIIVWLLCFFSVYGSIAQPVTSRSSPTITVADSRLMGVLNMFAPRYTDTTAANVQKGIDSTAAVIYTYDCNCLWFRQLNPKKWSHVVTVDGRIDTLFAQLPAFFDSVTRSPNTILKILQGNGLVSGGRVTLDSCFSIDVAPGLISLNYNQVTFAQVIRLSLAAANVFDRTDAVVVDGFGVVSILKGAAGNIAPYIDPSSQVLLATIPVPANATCLTVTQEIIYDQNIGSPEWTLSTFGTITSNPNNAANPFHLSKAYFISTYTDSSSLIFTKPSGNDTVKAGQILKFFPYFNGLFNNQLIGQFYLGSTPASSRIVLNPYFNINDSNQYQIGAVPLSAWSWPGGSIFNKLVLSFAGYDTSGAKGLYLDWIQLQTGITNVETLLTLTTNGTSGASTLIGNTLNIPIYSGGGSGINIYNTDSLLKSDRTINANNFFLRVLDISGEPLMLISPTTGTSEIRAFNAATDNEATISANATASESTFALGTVFNSAFGPTIRGVGTTNDITYTADTHTFNGDIINPNDSISTPYNMATFDGDTLKRSRFANLQQTLIAGSELTQDNEIDIDATFRLQVVGDHSGEGVFKATNTGGSGFGLEGDGNTAGVYGSSSFGYGLYGLGETAGIFAITNSVTGNGVFTTSVDAPVIRSQTLSSNTSSVIPNILIERIPNGAVNGIGASIDFFITNNGGNAPPVSSIINKLTDVTTDAEQSEFDITGINTGTAQVLLTISGTGIFTLVQGLQNFANNAAAIGGGLVAGNLYRNGDAVNIVH